MTPAEYHHACRTLPPDDAYLALEGICPICKGPLHSTPTVASMCETCGISWHGQGDDERLAVVAHLVMPEPDYTASGFLWHATRIK